MSDGSKHFEIRIKTSALKELESLPDTILRRIQVAILNLANDPRPKTCKKLQGRHDYRIRVGDYRVLYFVNESAKVIEIVAVKHRKDAYKS